MKEAARHNGLVADRLLGAQASARQLAPALCVVLFAGLTALGAQVRIPVPGTPVPMTLQTVPVLLAGICLGARNGVFSQVLYLSLGFVGLPVFADGAAGPAYFAGPTAGFLLGFVLAPLLAGLLIRQLRPSTQAQALGGRVALACAVALSTVVIFACGIGWICLAITGGDLGAALQMGLYPFLAGAVLKWALASGIGCVLPQQR